VWGAPWLRAVAACRAPPSLLITARRCGWSAGTAGGAAVPRADRRRLRTEQWRLSGRTGLPANGYMDLVTGGGASWADGDGGTTTPLRRAVRTAAQRVDRFVSSFFHPFYTRGSKS
jgi:hypothetical protein